VDGRGVHRLAHRGNVYRGHIRVRQRGPHGRMIAQGRQQDDALQAELPHEHADVARHLLARDVERLHHQVQVRLAAALDGTGLELTQVVTRLVVEEADEEGAGAGEAAGVEIGLIVELPDGLLDAIPCFLPNAALVVDHAGYGLRRYPGAVCDHLDRRGASPRARLFAHRDTVKHMSALSTGAPILDLLVIAVCVVGIVGFGLAVSRRRARAEEYFLAARASRWPAIGLALFASNISSTAIVGLAGAAYVMGISVYDYEWSAGVVLVFYCVFLLPFVLRSRVYTMPEFLERRYDGRVRLYFAALNVFLNVFVDSAAALYCGGLVCRMLFPGLPLWAIVAALAGAAGLYTLAGGLRAVIYTQAVQAVLLIAGAVTITAAAFIRVGGWDVVTHGVPAAMLSLIRPAGDPGV